MQKRNGLVQLREHMGESLQCILFDLDGTLRHSRPSSTQAFFDCAVRLGAQDSQERRLQAFRWTHYYWAQSPDLLQDVADYPEMDDPFWTKYTRRSLEAFGCTPECIDELAGEVKRYMQEEHQSQDCVAEDVPETLHALKTAGYCLGVISNRQGPFHDYLVATGLDEYFGLALAAGEVGSWKPDPLIFQHAIQRIGTDPARSIYIGDNYYADVIGAQCAGLQPVLLDPDEIFPDADCPVIHHIGDLHSLVEWRSS